jgi:hypothetical protein
VSTAEARCASVHEDRKLYDNPSPLFASIADAAGTLGVSEWNVKQFLREGLLSAPKIGRRTVIEYGSVHTLAESLPKATFAAPTRQRKKLVRH